MHCAVVIRALCSGLTCTAPWSYVHCAVVLRALYRLARRAGRRYDPESVPRFLHPAMHHLFVAGKAAWLLQDLGAVELAGRAAPRRELYDSFVSTLGRMAAGDPPTAAAGRQRWGEKAQPVVRDHPRGRWVVLCVSTIKKAAVH